MPWGEAMLLFTKLQAAFDLNAHMSTLSAVVDLHRAVQ